MSLEEILVVSLLDFNVMPHHVVEAQLVVPVVVPSTTAADDVRGPEPVVFRVEAVEDHLWPVVVLPVDVRRSVLHVLLVDSPDVNRMSSHDDHQARNDLVSERLHLQLAFRVYHCRPEDVHDLGQVVSSRAPRDIVAPLLTLHDGAQDFQHRRVMAFEVPVERRHSVMSEHVVQILSSLLDVRFVSFLAPDLGDKVLQVDVLEVPFGWHNRHVVPVVEPVDSLELFGILDEVSSCVLAHGLVPEFLALFRKLLWLENRCRYRADLSSTAVNP